MIALFLVCGAVWLLLADLIFTADLLRSEARLRRDIARGTYMYGQKRIPSRAETIQRRILRYATGAMILFAVVLAFSLR